MRVWRLAKGSLAAVLNGEGNRRRGARWNSPGRGIVYTSLNLSLAVLETLVHTRSDLLPSDLASVEIEVPDDAALRTVRLADFPEDWKATAQDDWFRRAGDAWLAGARELSLLAPSVIVPREMNAMLNPLHVEMRRGRVIEVSPFRLDPRVIG